MNGFGLNTGGLRLATLLACLTISLLAISTGTGSTADTVRVSTTGSTGDAPILVALERGYFADEDIDLELINIASAAKAIAPLGSKDLDVAGGAVSVGLYNAIERGINIKVVADRTHTEENIPYQTIFIRQALADSGEVRTLADLKGKTIALTAKGVTAHSVLNQCLKTVGLTLDDMNIVYMNYAQQATALENGAVDASMMGEPFATTLVNNKLGVRMFNTEDYYPHDQVTVFLYGETLTVDNRDLGVRFMKALIRGARDYDAALVEGQLRGEDGEEIIKILAKHLKPSEDILFQMYSHSVDPDGQVNLESMKIDWEFSKGAGWISGEVTPEDIFDPYFVEMAREELSSESSQQ